MGSGGNLCRVHDKEAVIGLFKLTWPEEELPPMEEIYCVMSGITNGFLVYTCKDCKLKNNADDS